MEIEPGFGFQIPRMEIISGHFRVLVENFAERIFCRRRLLGRVIQHFGEAVGSGMHAKMANQIMVAVHLAALAEALAYGKRAGLDLHVLVDILKSGRAGSEILEVNARGSSMATWRKSVRWVR